MTRSNILRRRIRIFRLTLLLPLPVLLALGLVVWNSSEVHRHFLNVLWYASLSIYAGLALIPGSRLSEAKQELDMLNHSVDCPK
jgi:hypothetical protein